MAGVSYEKAAAEAEQGLAVAGLPVTQPWQAHDEGCCHGDGGHQDIKGTS